MVGVAVKVTGNPVHAAPDVAIVTEGVTGVETVMVNELLFAVEVV